jgi:hypothetical protein
VSAPVAPPTVPGWSLRAAVMVTGLGLAAALVLGRGVPLPSMLLGLAVVTAAAARPGTSAPGLLLLCAVLAELFNGTGQITGRSLLQVALLHAVHLLASLAAVVPAEARVELAALRPTLRRYVVVQAAVLPVAGAAAIAPAGPVPAWLLVAAGTAAVGLAALPVVLLKGREGRVRRARRA